MNQIIIKNNLSKKFNIIISIIIIIGLYTLYYKFNNKNLNKNIIIKNNLNKIN